MSKPALLFFVSLVFLLHSPVVESAKVAPNTAHFLTMIRENDSLKLKKRFYLRKVNNINYINAFVRLTEGAEISSLIDLGVEIHPLWKDITAARIPVESLDSVIKLGCVKYVQVGTKVRKRMDTARAVSLVDNVQNGTGLTGPYTGKDVVIGIIDNGFQYDHINFYNADGTQTRIKRVWDQNKTGTTPSGYSYGTEYSTQTAIFAAKNDFTDETHATHVTGIAAGSDKNNGNTYYGVAPDADLVLVSYNQSDNTTDNVSLSDGIKYIYDYASSVNKPCVVNMSLGSHYGPHDGSSVFDQVCDGLQGAGRLLVGAVGNEGSDNLHVSKTFSSNTDTLKTFFKFYDTSELTGQTDIWGQANKDFLVKVVVYKKSTSEIVYSSSFLDAATDNSKVYSLSSATTGVSGKIYVYTERNEENSKPNALVYVDLTSIKSGYYVGLVVTATDGSTVHGWADDYYSYLGSNSIAGWTDGNSENSMGEVGGTGKKIISVGAYTTKSSVTNINNSTYGAGQTTGALATFSSTGPTIDNRTKPDITAPGTLIVSSFSSAVLNNSTYSNMFVKKNTVNGVGYYYGMMQGTSMSTPFVTGVLATWLGAKTDLTPTEVRSVFQSSSIIDSFTGTIDSEGSNSWGYGKIDAWNGIKACIKLTALTETSGTVEVKLYPNPFTDQFNILFTASDSDVIVTLYGANGQMVMKKVIGNVETAQELSLNLNSFSSGVYFAKFSGQKAYSTYRIIKQ